ncbi:hypothetical protein SAMN06296065_12610 [Novosphingobium panipatense]|uniref:Uncharacterized protein n=1 Tax=Novosphingobium panipatense TaxID=428991 RepID=A0ABY1QW45_9SPHN|nr:hypothetical protein SAMN06296065_12610 [Novosphingobium panipatense]
MDDPSRSSMRMCPSSASPPFGLLSEKLNRHMRKVQARGKVVLASDYGGIQAAGVSCLATITMPKAFRNSRANF